MIWESVTPPLRPGDIEKLAIGPKKAINLEFTDWETILTEIIVGDAFGVDRMDYLLRDSHHVGVVYGKFDHHRLIDTLRILPPAPSGENGESQEPALGMEEGGIQSAEALMLARYFMYSQVYFHPVRRIYNIHLTDFLKEWLDHGAFATDLESHLKTTDSEVTVALREAAFEEEKVGHTYARRIVLREHFKCLYRRNPQDVSINPESGELVFKALADQYGEEHFRHDRYRPKSGAPDFPVQMRDGRIISSITFSEVLSNIPVVSIDYVFADRQCFAEANTWLNDNHGTSINEPEEEEQDG